MFSRYVFAALVGMAVLACGCHRDSVKVYHVAKDDSDATPTPVTAAPAAPNPADASAMNSPHTEGAPMPQIKYTLPAGWQEAQPSELRTASFMVANPNGEPADVGVIPLPVTGQEIQLVNMWRQQLQLPPATETNDDNLAVPVTVGSESGKLFDIVSQTNLIDGKLRARILVAMATHGSVSWFFKMVGEESFVEGKKDQFIQFLKSVSYSEAPAQPGAPAANMNPDASANKPVWTVPSDWQEAPPSQFLLAKYTIAGDGDAKAEINISQLAGEGGGLSANVNRWRRQLGLDPVEGAELNQLVSPVSTGGTPASLVDFTGTDAKTGKKARLIGVILPLAGQTWFYKLMGDESVVAKQKDAFIKFIQSARYPDVN